MVGGLLSLTYRFYANGFPQAMTSTAYTADHVLAWWRACSTGQVTWLNSVDCGATYRAGDAWGCIGTWYAGPWRTPAAEGYISSVKTYLPRRIWTSPGSRCTGAEPDRPETFLRAPADPATRPPAWVRR